MDYVYLFIYLFNCILHPLRVKQYSNTNNKNTIQHFLQKKESLTDMEPLP